MSCSNKSDSFCFNNGQCISNHCVCKNLCYVGARCKISNNIVNLPFPSAILQDLPSTRHIYIAVLTILVILGIISNILALCTFLRERIRLTSRGVYLIMFCLCDLLLMVFLPTNILTIVEYDSQSYRLWSCQIIPYISLTIGFTIIWLSVGITVEKVLIECFNMNIDGSRRRALLSSLAFLVFASVSKLYVIFTRYSTEDLRKRRICMFNFNSHPKWSYVKTISSYIHVIIPCTLHLICIICILTTIVRRKILLYHQTNKHICCVWLKQMYNHRDFFIPPLCIIICLLPNSIYVYLLNACIPYSDLVKLRIHIVFVLMLHIPHIFIYMIYVYPSALYMGEFYQTFLYRKLCCYCYWKRTLSDRRRRAASVVTLQELVEHNVHRNEHEYENLD